MILNSEILHDAIAKRRPLKALFDSKNNPLLDDFVVRDYVTNDRIPVIRFNGEEISAPPDIFFEGYQYLSEIDVLTLLKQAPRDFVEEYKKDRIFPYDFSIHFFDSFLVADIHPKSLATEFLVLSPIADDKTENDMSAGMLAAIGITGIYSAISSDPMAQVALNMKIDKLLEFLRTGVGKRKRFGLF